MSLALLIVVVICALAVAYPMVLYPLLVQWLARLRPRPWKSADVDLSVAHLITVFNEEKRIGAKLENAIAVRAPNGGLRTYVISDGSDDGTERIVRSFADHDVHWIGCERQGKERAQMTAIEQIDADILVFSDASSLLDEESLRALVRPFADPDVASVSGTDRLATDGKGTGEDIYVDYEMRVRRAESRVDSLVGLSGCYFAVRREVIDGWVPDVPNDMGSALVSIIMGKRAVSVDDAHCTYGATTSSAREYKRKKRTALRGLRGLIAYRKALTSGPRLACWQIFSHKVMRFLAPFFSLVALIAISVAALLGAAWAHWLGLLTLAGFGLAVAGLVVPALARFKPIRALLFLVVSMAAVGAAWLAVFKSDSAALWAPTERP